MFAVTKYIKFIKFAWREINKSQYSVLGFILFLLGINLMMWIPNLFDWNSWIVYSLYWGGAMLMLMRVFFVLGEISGKQ